MLFNDRRKAKKAASATTKAQISAMAKAGTLRQVATTPAGRQFGNAERQAVKDQVRGDLNDFRPRKQRFADAAAKVDKASDVRGYDGPAYRKMSEENNKRGQQKKWLPKKPKK